ncbi:MAG: SlyX family protein [Deltaproteobacteria bacterium]|nr:SlyX family protein [Deltaproteobacteria bacterium]
MDNSRLVEIETKIAYQENTLRELNEVVCNQQKQIDQLERTCNILLESVKALTKVSEKREPINEKPPHY